MLMHPRLAVRVSSSPSAEDSSRMAADVAVAFPDESPFAPESILVVTFYAVARFTNRTSQDRL